MKLFLLLGNWIVFTKRFLIFLTASGLGKGFSKRLGGLGGIDKGLGCLNTALGAPGNGLGGLRKGSRGLEGLNKSFKVREFLVKTFE